MAIDTGLSVPVFNVLKYLLVLLFIDVVVRRSLEAIEYFFRRLSLFHGRSVVIQKNLIDRYNLFRASFRANSRNAIFWIALISCAYAVEICLEFSSDAITNVVALKDRINVFNASHGVCTWEEIMSGNTVDRFVSLAAKCIDVDLDQDTYTMYNIFWELDNRRITTPLCVKTADNVLHKGKLIYDTLQYPEGSRKANSSKRFLQGLRANSWNSNGDSEREVITLQFTDRNMFDPRRIRIGNKTFLRASLKIPIPNTNAVCGGILYGKIGEGQMLLQMTGCGELISSSDITSDEISADAINLDDADPDFSSAYHRASYNFMYISGTAAIFKDAKHIETEPWIAYVAALPEMVLVDFTRGVIDKPDRPIVQTYAALLGSCNGRDFESINKYAVGFKYCASYRVPLESDEVREQESSMAREGQKVTVVVYEWALVTMILWPTVLCIVSLCLNVYANRKGLPSYLLGERAIAQRWACRETDRKVGDGDVDDQGCSGSPRSAVFLTVEERGEEDDVVASYENRNSRRDVSRKFKRV